MHKEIVKTFRGLWFPTQNRARCILIIGKPLLNKLNGTFTIILHLLDSVKWTHRLLELCIKCVCSWKMNSSGSYFSVLGRILYMVKFALIFYSRKNFTWVRTIEQNQVFVCWLSLFFYWFLFLPFQKNTLETWHSSLREIFWWKIWVFSRKWTFQRGIYVFNNRVCLKRETEQYKPKTKNRAQSILQLF